MSAAARSGAFVKWRKSPESIAREEARQAAEQAETIVRVVRNVDGSNEAAIYRKGRLGLKYQNLTSAEVDLLGDADSAFFRARWDAGDVQWVLLGRSSETF